MSYLARLKAIDLENLPTQTTAITAISASGSFGGSPSTPCEENHQLEDDPVPGSSLPFGWAGDSARFHPANSASLAPQATAITAKGPYGSFGSAQVAAFHNSAIREPTANAPGADATTWGRWRVQYPALPAIEIRSVPDASRSEVVAIYPGAVIEALLYPPQRKAIPTEAAELRALIERVLADAPHEWDEVHRIACADPEAALTSFRLLAADLPPVPDYSRFDLPTCEQCGNLDQYRGRDGFRPCVAARRGELSEIAKRDYSPVPDIGRRCEGFAPKLGDPDQRTGIEGWPGLVPPKQQKESPQ